MSQCRPLRRLSRAEISTGAIWERARQQAEREARGVTEDALRGFARSHGIKDPLPADFADLARLGWELKREREIAGDLVAQASAERDREYATAARGEVARAYGLDLADLTGEVAQRLLDDAWQRAKDLGCTGLRYQRDPAAQRNARAAATRAQTQHRRLEDYLVAAGLIDDPWEGD